MQLMFVGCMSIVGKKGWLFDATGISAYQPGELLTRDCVSGMQILGRFNAAFHRFSQLVSRASLRTQQLQVSLTARLADLINRNSAFLSLISTKSPTS
ncbi:hypothetical protein RRG08_022738 [Elysia crispata]|uniref:Uncharacterized protein n=1 Tax=Elysia crispata TaxID=231223 RepID=A0AAE0ZE27_9GAST|nr:hypothetical protein RRG08_022738 [Elysia crispata]